MILWRLTRSAYTALDGAGPMAHGGRYSSPGLPVVNFTSEAALAVLITLRYLPADLVGVSDDYLLGYTEIDADPEWIADLNAHENPRTWGDDWLKSGRSLLAATPSAVLPEADLVMMNPRHPDAAKVTPLIYRKFDFATCLHRPPMLGKFEEKP
jgi:RES domain-containing protein